MKAKKAKTPDLNPLHFLRGSYATSYAGYIYMYPPVPKATGVPQIGAYQPNFVKPGTFDQVSGYRLFSSAMYLNFDGNGLLDGAGYVNRGGYTPTYNTYTGTYTVNATVPPTVFSGTLEITDQGGFLYEYYWIMSDSWRRLEFITLHGNPNGNVSGNKYDHDSVVAGTLTRV